MKHKVLVYVMPGPTGRPQLPVFKHRDHPGAGVQVPAGTVEAGEAPESAAYREMWEESGLDARAVRLARKLAEAPEPEWQQVRHVCLFEPLGPCPSAGPTSSRVRVRTAAWPLPFIGCRLRQP